MFGGNDNSCVMLPLKNKLRLMDSFLLTLKETKKKGFFLFSGENKTGELTSRSSMYVYID